MVEVLKILTGTEAQIKYANEVREYVLYQLNHLAIEEKHINGLDNAKATEKAKKVILRTSKAKAVLNMFASSFKYKNFINNFEYLWITKLKDKSRLSQADFNQLGDISIPSYFESTGEYVKKEVAENNLLIKNSRIIKNYFDYAKAAIYQKDYFPNRKIETIEEAVKELESLDSQSKAGKKAKEVIDEGNQKITDLKAYEPYFEAKRRLEKLISLLNSGHFSINQKIEIDKNLEQLEKLIKSENLSREIEEDLNSKFDDLSQTLNEQVTKVKVLQDSVKKGDLPELKGTAKQVKFATDVRKYVLKQLKYMQKATDIKISKHVWLGKDEKEKSELRKKYLKIEHDIPDNIQKFIIKKEFSAAKILSYFAKSYYNKSVIKDLVAVGDREEDLANSKIDETKFLSIAQKKLRYMHLFAKRLPYEDDFLPDFDDDKRTFELAKATITRKLEYVYANLSDERTNSLALDDIEDQIINLKQLSDNSEYGAKAKDIIDSTENKVRLSKILFSHYYFQNLKKHYYSNYGSDYYFGLLFDAYDYASDMSEDTNSQELKRFCESNNFYYYSMDEIKDDYESAEKNYYKSQHDEIQSRQNQKVDKFEKWLKDIDSQDNFKRFATNQANSTVSKSVELIDGEDKKWQINLIFGLYLDSNGKVKRKDEFSILLDNLTYKGEKSLFESIELFADKTANFANLKYEFSDYYIKANDTYFPISDKQYDKLNRMYRSLVRKGTSYKAFKKIQENSIKSVKKRFYDACDAINKLDVKNSEDKINDQIEIRDTAYNDLKAIKNLNFIYNSKIFKSLVKD